jgi:alpha-tubulin suppressor-like RCC1 family protein
VCACGIVNFYGLGFSSAIKTDGTLWAWGSNSGGPLGLGDATSRSSPVQVGALTTWNSVSLCGGVNTRGAAGAMLALRS